MRRVALSFSFRLITVGAFLDFTTGTSYHPSAIICFAHTFACHLSDVYLTLHHSFAPASVTTANNSHTNCTVLHWSHLRTMQVSLSLRLREMRTRRETIQWKVGDHVCIHPVPSNYLTTLAGRICTISWIATVWAVLMSCWPTIWIDLLTTTILGCHLLIDS